MNDWKSRYFLSIFRDLCDIILLRECKHARYPVPIKQWNEPRKKNIASYKIVVHCLAR